MTNQHKTFKYVALIPMLIHTVDVCALSPNCIKWTHYGKVICVCVCVCLRPSATLVPKTM